MVNLINWKLSFQLMNLKTIVLLTGLSIATPIVAPVAQNTVMAQDTRAEQYQRGRGLYVDGIQFLGYGMIQNDGSLPTKSVSAKSFYQAENIFGALADVDPNYANGRALELQILSSLALDGDIDFVASRPDKDKILPFLLKVANNEYEVNFNYLDDRNSEVKKMKKKDVRYENFYADKRGGLLQAVYLINPNGLNNVKGLDEDDILLMTSRNSD